MKPSTSPDIPITDVSEIRLESATAQSGSGTGIAHRAGQLARRLASDAIDGNDVSADFGVLPDVALVAVADLDFEVLCSDAIEQCADLGIRAVHERDHLEQLVEWNRDPWAFWLRIRSSHKLSSETLDYLRQ